MKNCKITYSNFLPRTTRILMLAIQYYLPRSFNRRIQREAYQRPSKMSGRSHRKFPLLRALLARNSPPGLRHPVAIASAALAFPFTVGMGASGQSTIVVGPQLDRPGPSALRGCRGLGGLPSSSSSQTRFLRARYLRPSDPQTPLLLPG